VSEGIETEVQAHQLWAMGCKLGQVFAFSEAVDAKSVASSLRRHGRRRGRSHSPPEAYFRHLGGASGPHLDLKSSIDIASELGWLKFLQNFRQDVDEELRFHHILWP
jgi:hypothetical protein